MQGMQQIDTAELGCHKQQVALVAGVSSCRELHSYMLTYLLLRLGTSC
jgi:hypothetical protein